MGTYWFGVRVVNVKTGAVASTSNWFTLTGYGAGPVLYQIRPWQWLLGNGTFSIQFVFAHAVNGVLYQSTQWEQGGRVNVLGAGYCYS